MHMGRYRQGISLPVVKTRCDEDVGNRFQTFLNPTRGWTWQTYGLNIVSAFHALVLINKSVPFCISSPSSFLLLFSIFAFLFFM